MTFNEVATTLRDAGMPVPHIGKGKEKMMSSFAVLESGHMIQAGTVIEPVYRITKACLLDTVFGKAAGSEPIVRLVRSTDIDVEYRLLGFTSSIIAEKSKCTLLKNYIVVGRVLGAHRVFAETIDHLLHAKQVIDLPEEVRKEIGAHMRQLHSYQAQYQRIMTAMAAQLSVEENDEIPVPAIPPSLAALTDVKEVTSPEKIEWYMRNRALRLRRLLRDKGIVSKKQDAPFTHRGLLSLKSALASLGIEYDHDALVSDLTVITSPLATWLFPPEGA